MFALLKLQFVSPHAQNSEKNKLQQEVQSKWSLFPIKSQRLAGYLDLCPGFRGQQDDFFGQSLAVLQESVKSSVAVQGSMDFPIPEPETPRGFPEENVLRETELFLKRQSQQISTVSSKPCWRERHVHSSFQWLPHSSMAWPRAQPLTYLSRCTVMPLCQLNLLKRLMMSIY